MDRSRDGLGRENEEELGEKLRKYSFPKEDLKKNQESWPSPSLATTERELAHAVRRDAPPLITGEDEPNLADGPRAL